MQSIAKEGVHMQYLSAPHQQLPPGKLGDPPCHSQGHFGGRNMLSYTVARTKRSETNKKARTRALVSFCRIIIFFHILLYQLQTVRYLKYQTVYNF